jgi:hypothetical protein
MRASGQRHAPAALYPRGPLNGRLGGPQSRSGQRLEEKSFRLCRRSNLDRLVVQSVARSFSVTYTECWSRLYEYRSDAILAVCALCWPCKHRSIHKTSKSEVFFTLRYLALNSSFGLCSECGCFRSQRFGSWFYFRHQVKGKRKKKPNVLAAWSI